MTSRYPAAGNAWTRVSHTTIRSARPPAASGTLSSFPITGARPLVASRELLDRDREVLADWRAREQNALNGRGWRKPEPLAVEAEARQLLARAEQHSAPPSEAGRGV